MPGAIKNFKKRGEFRPEQAVNGAGAKPQAAGGLVNVPTRATLRGSEANTARSKGSPAPDHREPSGIKQTHPGSPGWVCEESR